MFFDLLAYSYKFCCLVLTLLATFEGSQFVEQTRINDGGIC